MKTQLPMKTVVILAYDFPPYISVGGLRPYSWFLNFKSEGIYPIVITRQYNNKYSNNLNYIDSGISNKTIVEKTENGTILRTPYFPNLSNRLLLKYGQNRFKILRKTITAYYEFLQFVFFIGPRVNLYKEANNFIKENKVDFIVATGDPYVLFKYASALSKKHKLPWFADYRDLWTGNLMQKKDVLIKKWFYYFEKKYVSTATAITTVSDVQKIKILNIIKNKEIKVLFNGFNDIAVDSVKYIDQKHDNLSIAVVGTIYPSHPIELFLESCNNFIIFEPKAMFSIHFYGINIKERIESLCSTKYIHLKDRLVFHKNLPNETLLQELKTMNLLFLVNTRAFYGSKIFEFIALKRKILLCFSNEPSADLLWEKYGWTELTKEVPQDLQAKLILKTESGIIVKNREHLVTILTDSYSELIKNGHIACNSKNIEYYSRAHQAKELVNFIQSF